MSYQPHFAARPRTRLVLRAVAFIVAATGLVSQAGPARAADQDFKLINKTGYQIDNVYVSEHSAQQWGSDVMGRDAVADGVTVDITFPKGTEACSYDIKVKYHDSDTAEWGDIDLCKFSKVSLFWDGHTTHAVTE